MRSASTDLASARRRRAHGLWLVARVHKPDFVGAGRDHRAPAPLTAASARRSFSPGAAKAWYPDRDHLQLLVARRAQRPGRVIGGASSARCSGPAWTFARDADVDGIEIDAQRVRRRRSRRGSVCRRRRCGETLGDRHARRDVSRPGWPKAERARQTRALSEPSAGGGRCAASSPSSASAICSPFQTSAGFDGLRGPPSRATNHRRSDCGASGPGVGARQRMAFARAGVNAGAGLGESNDGRTPRA